MTARLLSWWKRVRKPLEVLGIIIVCLLVLSLLVMIVLTYIFNVNVPSLHGKTLWDWLQLLIIPAVLAVGGYLFNYTMGRSERAATEKRIQAEQDIAQDNQREAMLQTYIDKISELLLKGHLGERTADYYLKPEYEQVCNIARVRTITVLTQLDARRVGYVFSFLREARLMTRTLYDNDAVSLKDADFREVNWSRANLFEANLSRANLSRANLSGANFNLASLRGAILFEANLSGSILYGADLEGANLKGANFYGADLREANLRQTNLSNADLACTDLREADLSRSDRMEDFPIPYGILPEADLSGANLSGANLSGAKITDEQLKKAKSLKGATMPDGSKHP